MKGIASSIVAAVCLVSMGSAIAQELPKTVTDLGLSDVQIREKPNAKYGRRISGTLPSGFRVEVDLNGDNAIEDVEARGNTLFPVADIQTLVPEPVLKNTAWPSDATLEKIEFERNGNIELEGRLADGREFDAEFAADGQMLELDIDD